MSEVDEGSVRPTGRRGALRDGGGSAAPTGCGLQERLPDWPRIWGACARRTRAWRVPPRWSPDDWREELDAEGLAAACVAIRLFDPSRGLPLGCYLYHQILASALARHRREWSYARRYRPSPAVPAPESRSDVDAALDLREGGLRRLVEGLPEGDRLLVELLYWDERTEAEVARRLGIGQQAVSKRKLRILATLRRSLGK